MRFLLFIWLLTNLPAYADEVSVHIKSAISKSPIIKSAWLTTSEKVAAASISKKQFLPTPSVNIERVNPSISDPSYDTAGISQIYRLQQPIWTWGRLSGSVHRTELELESAQQGLVQAEQQVALDTLQAWSEMTVASRKIEVLQDGLKQFRDLSAMVDRRIESGASAPAERATTAARLAQTSVQLEVMRATERLATRRLNQLSGLMPEGDTEIPNSNRAFTAPSRLAVLQFSPDLKMASLQTQMLFADAKIKKAQSLPELYARAEHQRYPSGQNANRIFIGFQSNFGAGLSALDESNVLEQKALSSQAEEEARRLEVELQYETTLQEMSRALSSLPDIQANVQAAADSASSIKRQFLSGKRTWLDVLNAVREAMQARLDMIDAQMALVRSQWHLKLMAMPPQQAVEQFESTVR